MTQIARGLRVLAAGVVVGVAGVMCVAGTASADPVFPPGPNPVPAPAPPLTQNALGAVGNSTPGTAPSVAPRVPSPQPAAAPAPATLVPATSGTLRDYFAGKGVKLEPQQPQNLHALDITLPVPPRWTQVPDPNVPDAFAVIADRSGTGNSLYTSNAQVVVYKLVGDFDPREAITHGYVDSQQLPAWQTTKGTMGDFGGFPSSVIEGTYRQNDMTLNTSRRHVIATSGADRYLVSLAVTTAVTQAVADAPATDAIVNGFRVTAPGAAPPAAPAAPAVPALPAHPPVPAPTR
ncbi:LpqN/LpqT family lipoprotein [Mycobacterium kyorinense]|uniref:LpqN/LpqT family lipoprotein n=1 Tax=Mycobacterium kyorinense TaxID=487514 RepID=UPI0005EEE42C|nr:LpqN/LpqT family lipoprotein [Mycobacterium kyorinense]